LNKKLQQCAANAVQKIVKLQIPSLPWSRLAEELSAVDALGLVQAQSSSADT
jgi:hypothetical protein